jgi:hypothetical protein
MIFGNDQYHATATVINPHKNGEKRVREEKRMKKKNSRKNVKLIIINGKYRFLMWQKGIEILEIINQIDGNQ